MCSNMSRYDEIYNMLVITRKNSDTVKFSQEAGWALEEVACNPGHVAVKGTPTIQTTAYHLWLNQTQVRENLKGIKR